MRTLATIVTTLVLASNASAATDQGKCFATQMKSLGKMCAAFAKCYGEQLATGTATDCNFILIANDQVPKIQKTEGKFECYVEGIDPFDESVGDLRQATEDAAEVLNPVLTANACAAKKMKAVGKYCSSVLKCHGTHIKTESAKPAPECIAKAAAKMDGKFTKLDSKDECTVEGNAASARTEIGDGADPVVVRYLTNDPTTTSTTTTTTTSTSTTSSTLGIEIAEAD